MKNIIITNHAKKRARRRLSWSQSVIKKMAKRAMLQGISLKYTKGQLHAYICVILSKDGVADTLRIYGENIFLFKDNTLITVYRIKNHYKKYLKYSR